MKHKKTWFFLCCAFLLCFLIPFVSVVKNEEMPYNIVSPALNVLATETSLKKCAVAGERISFCANEFDAVYGIEKIPAITILSLPPQEDGVLFLGSMKVIQNQTIARRDLEQLQFVPKNASVAQTSFTFCNSGTDMAYNLYCVLSFTQNKNEAPVFLEKDQFSLNLNTISDIAIYGRLRGSDPEGDALTFLVESYPQKGVLQLDEESGSYCYIPKSKKSGSDSFVYKIQDAYGNSSAPITVCVNIKNSDVGLVYQDLIGHQSHLAAITLSQANIMSGSEVGGFSLFDPNRSIRRDEFLVMAMESANYSIRTSQTPLSLLDKDAISSVYKDYISTALEDGIIDATVTDQGLYFYPDQAITRAEAAVIVQRLVQSAIPSEITVFADAQSVPAWAGYALSSLCDIGFLDTDENGNINALQAITRADGARLLFALYSHSNQK